jgi:hypothetical protein
MAVLATVLPFWLSSCATRRTAGDATVDKESLAGDSGKSGISGKEGNEELMGDICLFPEASGSEAFPARWRPGWDRGWGHGPTSESFDP